MVLLAGHSSSWSRSHLEGGRPRVHCGLRLQPNAQARQTWQQPNGITCLRPIDGTRRRAGFDQLAPFSAPHTELHWLVGAELFRLRYRVWSSLFIGEKLVGQKQPAYILCCGRAHLYWKETFSQYSRVLALALKRALPFRRSQNVLEGLP